MKKMRTLLAVLLSFSLCASLLAPAMAADETPDPAPTENEATEAATPEHTHNSKGTLNGKEGTWVCTLTSETVLGEDGEPICTLTEHTHSAACEGNEGFEIVCGKHVHTDACYKDVPVLGEDGQPVLGEDGQPTTEKQLTCLHEAHTHDASCYVCDTPVHTHGTGCQYQQVEKWVCNFVEKGQDGVKEEGNLPEVDGKSDKTPDEDHIYVYIENNSIGDAGLKDKAENDKGYQTVAKIDYAAAVEAYNAAHPDAKISGKNSNLSNEAFNALVKFALKNGYSTDTKGNKVTFTEDEQKRIDEMAWVYVKNSNGATDFNDNATDNSTVHADGHVHQWKIDSTTATCTEGGYTTYTCTRTYDSGRGTCGRTKVEYTPALGHDFPVDKADWHTDGADTHSITCSRCAEKMTQAHSWTVKQDWSEWKATEADPNTLERTRVLGCSANCGVADKVETQTKKVGQYLVTYVYKDTQGTVLGSGLVGKYYPGQTGTHTPPTIHGYTTPAGKGYSVQDQDIELEFVYQPVVRTLTVNHVYRYHYLDGTVETTTRTEEPTTYRYQQAYTTSADARGYRLEATPANASGVFDVEDITVTYYYDAYETDGEPTPPPTPIEEEVDDPNVPLVEEPDVDIEEPDVPLAEEPIEIEEPDVPLAEVPETGDGSGLWFVSAALSALGLVLLFFTRKREGQEG